MAKASRMKFDFITIASHQLRTPLSAMKWFLEMLLSGSGGKLTRRQHDFINEIYQSNERMIRVMKELKPLTDAANITVVTKFDVTARTEINGDEDKVRQVVRTILDNAIRYMIHGGLIIVKCVATLTSVTIQIQDTGVGIPAQERARVFQQFYRGSNVVRMRTDGSGLGLYIAKAIVEASRGTIGVSSAEGKGSLFSVTLPLDCAVPKKQKIEKTKKQLIF